MKKQFLILFAFISVLAFSQAPQRFNKVIVTGDITSPKFIKTGSTGDSVLLGNGSARSVNSLKTDTTSLSNRINTKEPLLPSTPSNPESRFLNGNKQWAEIVLGSGGYASNVYFTNLTSTIVGTYKQTSGTHELTETIASGTCNSNEVLIHTYLFEQPVGITTVDAGVWRFTMNSKISSNVGDSKFKIVQFRRSSTGVETDMFTIYSNTIENTDYQNFVIETVQPSFLVDSLDRFGCRVYATTTTTVNKIISYRVGDGYASYLNTPLALRHDQNRDKNGNPLYQHVTTSDISKWNTTSLNNTVDETLTSIKTKLGAASSVSDGYLKYQDFANFDGKQAKLNGSGFVKAFSGEITYDANNYEIAFSKNSGFNLPLGATTGTVLEGRTFGTAANSAVLDFARSVTTYGSDLNLLTGTSLSGYTSGASNRPSDSDGYVTTINFDNGSNPRMYAAQHIIDSYGDSYTRLSLNTTATSWSGWRKIYDSSNLTSSLSTNYISKWNGGSMVNSLIKEIGGITYWGSGEFGQGALTWDTGYAQLYSTDTNELRISSGSGTVKMLNTTQSTSPTTGALVVSGGGVGVGGHIYSGGDVHCGNIIATSSNSNFISSDVNIGYSTYQGYRLSVNGTGYFSGAVTASSFSGSGSNLTGVQKPITLTTNGTSGAATFENGVMNVPNYGSNATGGSYSPSISVGSNTANPVVYSALYTKNGTVYSSVIKGYIECTGSQGNTCTFNVSTYNGSTANLSIIGVGAQGTNMIIGSGSTGSNVVVSFTNPVGSGGIGFTLIVHYTN